MLDKTTHLGKATLLDSTNIIATNKWVGNIHIQAKPRMAMCDKVIIKTSYTHKELADNAKNNTRSMFEL